MAIFSIKEGPNREMNQDEEIYQQINFILSVEDCLRAATQINKMMKAYFLKRKIISDIERARTFLANVGNCSRNRVITSL